ELDARALVHRRDLFARLAAPAAQADRALQEAAVLVVGELRTRHRDELVGAVGQAVATVIGVAVVVRIASPVVGVVGLTGYGVLHAVLAPGHLVLGGDDLGDDLGVVAGTPLERERATLALAVEVGAAPVHATGDEHVVEIGAFQQQ